jgi:uncharacterized protein YigA (DUF484 family)
MKLKIKELKSRMEEVESVIEDHGMKLKRGRSKMSMEMIALFDHEMVHDKISRIKEGSRKREEEQASQLSLLAERGEQYKLTLQEKEELQYLRKRKKNTEFTLRKLFKRRRLNIEKPSRKKKTCTRQYYNN